MAKVMISMPEELLRALDAAARRRFASRSEFIRHLVRGELAAQALAERRQRGIDDIRAVTDRYRPIAPPEELVRADRER